MTALHKVSHASSFHPSAAAGSGRLVLGAMGPPVKELQLLLTSLGLYTGSVGGHFGPATLAAVKAFQRSRGLAVDGWAGPQTMAALRKGPDSSFTPADPGPVAPPSVSGPAAGQIASMLEWSQSKVGAPYAAVNPFRFGNVPWDGKPHKSVNGSGSTFNFPKGTQVFDCSGFVVASFRQLGIDLAARDLASSATINANANGFLQDISVQDLQPGDLITFKPHNGIGHVVIYLGDGQVVQASGGKGVNVAPLDWSRIQSARRVPVG